MGRHGYNEDCYEDHLQLGRWRGVIASATRGKRGQAFFRDLVEALDAMPVKELIRGDLENEEGAVCALGALGRHQGKDLSAIDIETCEEDYDWSPLGNVFDVAGPLTQEVMWENDEYYRDQSPAERWTRMRSWAIDQLLPETLIGKPEPEPEPELSQP